MAGRGIGDDLADVVLGIISAITAVDDVGRALVLGGDRMPGAHAGEPWILFDFDAPAVIIG